LASATLAARSAFADLKRIETANFSIEILQGLTMASFASFKDRGTEVRAKMLEAYGIELPGKIGCASGRGLEVMCFGPEQWMAIAERGSAGRDLELELSTKLAGCAAVADQTDSRAAVRVSGTKIREILAKGIGIDLDPSAFKAKSAAVTHASHIGIYLWQVDDRPTYCIAMFRSYADSFAHWLRDSAEEYLAD
jgi:heterotetrameric sarcosine oxidase gamma subunit